MANVFTTGVGVLVDALKNNIGTTITYRRGGLTVSLAVTKIIENYGADTTYGRLDYLPCDWIVKASLLILGGSAVEPDKNDQLEESDGAHWLTLPLDSEKCFRLWEQGLAYRIHTKRIKAPD